MPDACWSQIFFYKNPRLRFANLQLQYVLSLGVQMDDF